MRFTQAAVLVSFLICSAIVGTALFLTSGMKAELSHDALGTVTVFITVAIPCSWPWIRAYTAAGDDDGKLTSIIFCVASIGIAVASFKSISTAPAEGVGWNVIFYVLFIWVARVVIFKFLPA